MKILLVIGVVFVVVCLVIILVALFTPFRLRISSTNGEAVVNWSPWVRAGIHSGHGPEGLFFILAPGWKKFYSFDDVISRIGRRPQKKNRGIIERRWSKKWLKPKKFWKMLRAVRVNRLNIQLDTDDFVHNAYLVPVFEMFSFKTGYHTHINFMGRNEIECDAESSLYRMLKAWVF